MKTVEDSATSMWISVLCLNSRINHIFLSLVQPHTHMYTQRGKNPSLYFNQMCKVLRSHSGPCVYVCMQFQDRTPTENKGCTEWMSEMFILCRTSISYQEFKNRERPSLYEKKKKKEKDLKKPKQKKRKGIYCLVTSECYCKLAKLGYCLWFKSPTFQ